MRFKTFSILLTLVILVGLNSSSFAQNEKEVKLSNLVDSISYIIGHDLGQNFYKQNIEINPQLLVDAIIIGMNKQASLFDADQSNKILTEYVADLRVKKAGSMKKDGVLFLEANKDKAGVNTTSSGLQYIVLREGSGAKPTAADQVMVHYSGTLIDGTKFDSSYDRGEPITFPLAGVIKGWTEGLQLMKEGAKYKFFISPELGYGDQGAGTSIPGGAVLIFDVELIKVIKDSPDSEK
jgi:FKBP-type peptidyl-prolyl cis-trans isomerase